MGGGCSTTVAECHDAMRAVLPLAVAVAATLLATEAQPPPPPPTSIDIRVQPVGYACGEPNVTLSNSSVSITSRDTGSGSWDSASDGGEPYVTIDIDVDIGPDLVRVSECSVFRTDFWNSTRTRCNDDGTLSFMVYANSYCWGNPTDVNGLLRQRYTDIVAAAAAGSPDKVWAGWVHPDPLSSAMDWLAVTTAFPLTSTRVANGSCFDAVQVDIDERALGARRRQQLLDRGLDMASLRAEMRGLVGGLRAFVFNFTPYASCPDKSPDKDGDGYVDADSPVSPPGCAVRSSCEALGWDAMAEPGTVGIERAEGDLVVLRPGQLEKHGLLPGQPATVLSVSAYGYIALRREALRALPQVEINRGFFRAEDLASAAGSMEVCGASQGCTWNCTEAVSWQAARDRCAAAGGRLCSLAELLANETKSTGCGFDAVPVWSSSGGSLAGCGPGEVQTAGGGVCAVQDPDTKKYSGCNPAEYVARRYQVISNEQAVFGPVATRDRVRLEHAFTGQVLPPEQMPSLPLLRQPGPEGAVFRILGSLTLPALNGDYYAEPIDPADAGSDDWHDWHFVQGDGRGNLGGHTLLWQGLLGGKWCVAATGTSCLGWALGSFDAPASGGWSFYDASQPANSRWQAEPAAGARRVDRLLLLLRFDGVVVPAGGTIASAKLVLEFSGGGEDSSSSNSNVSTAPLTLEIRAELPGGGTAAAGLAGPGLFDVARRNYTASSILWSTAAVDPNVNGTAAPTVLRSAEFAAVLQEVVDQPGWAAAGGNQSSKPVSVMLRYVTGGGTRWLERLSLRTGLMTPALEVVHRPPNSTVLPTCRDAARARAAVRCCADAARQCDVFPADPAEHHDRDRDGLGDNADPDDDNDGVPDAADPLPMDGASGAMSTMDGDNDMVADRCDAAPADGRCHKPTSVAHDPASGNRTCLNADYPPAWPPVPLSDLQSPIAVCQAGSKLGGWGRTTSQLWECSGHGSCNQTSERCICDALYAGPGCEVCAASAMLYPHCVPDPCLPDPCTVFGGCYHRDALPPHSDWSEVSLLLPSLRLGWGCHCAPRFAGRRCEICARGFVFYPDCLPDPCYLGGRETCNFRGTCNTVMLPAAWGRGLPQPAPSCACDMGFVGDRCEYALGRTVVVERQRGAGAAECPAHCRSQLASCPLNVTLPGGSIDVLATGCMTHGVCTTALKPQPVEFPAGVNVTAAMVAAAAAALAAKWVPWTSAMLEYRQRYPNPPKPTLTFYESQNCSGPPLAPSSAATANYYRSQAVRTAVEVVSARFGWLKEAESNSTIGLSGSGLPGLLDAAYGRLWPLLGVDVRLPAAGLEVGGGECWPAALVHGDRPALRDYFVAEAARTPGTVLLNGSAANATADEIDRQASWVLQFTAEVPAGVQAVGGGAGEKVCPGPPPPPPPPRNRTRPTYLADPTPEAGGLPGVLVGLGAVALCCGGCYGTKKLRRWQQERAARRAVITFDDPAAAEEPPGEAAEEEKPSAAAAAPPPPPPKPPPKPQSILAGKKAKAEAAEARRAELKVYEATAKWGTLYPKKTAFQQQDFVRPPTAAEVAAFGAEALGLDVLAERELLYLAEAALVAPLPLGWGQGEDSQGQILFLPLEGGGEVWQREHPFLPHFRKLIEKQRGMRAEREAKARREKAAADGGSGGESGEDTATAADTPAQIEDAASASGESAASGEAGMLLEDREFDASTQPPNTVPRA
eukprot:SAG22_NODE_55_length_23749_cov_24.622918_8_plen_1706_part_00